MSDIDRTAREAAEKLEQVAQDVAKDAAEKLKRVAVEVAIELDQAAVEAEFVRVASEETRQIQEKDRRIAEGGLQNVPGEEDGRVEAESGRQEAEALRVLRDRKLLPRISLLVALPLVLVALAPSVLGLVLIQQEINDRCQDGELNRAAIRDTVLGGLPGLGATIKGGRVVKAGVPTIEYWRSHPGERDVAIVDAQITLDRFPNIDC